MYADGDTSRCGRFRGITWSEFAFILLMVPPEGEFWGPGGGESKRVGLTGGSAGCV